MELRAYVLSIIHANRSLCEQAILDNMPAGLAFVTLHLLNCLQFFEGNLLVKDELEKFNSSCESLKLTKKSPD